MALKLAVADRAVDSAIRPRSFGVRRWWLLALAVAAALGVLAFAEAVWLKEFLPREYVARTSLVVLPRAGSTRDSSLEWTKTMLDRADQDTVLRSVIQRIDLRDGPSGDPFSPDRLRQLVRFRTECVRLSDNHGKTVEGARLSATVRGADNGAVLSVANAWVDAFLQQNSDLATELPAASTTALLPCKEL